MTHGVVLTRICLWMSGQDSLRVLQDIFPSVAPATLQRTLQSCKFSVEAAAEMLAGEQDAPQPTSTQTQRNSPSKKPSQVITTFTLCWFLRVEASLCRCILLAVRLAVRDSDASMNGTYECHYGTSASQKMQDVQIYCWESRLLTGIQQAAIWRGPTLSKSTTH